MTGPNVFNEIVAACQQNSAEIGQAFSQTFNLPIQVELGTVSAWTAETELDGFEGPGLVFLIQFQDVALLVVLPQTAWLQSEASTESDATQARELSVLAQELSRYVLPENLSADACYALQLSPIRQSILTACPTDETSYLPLRLATADSNAVVATLIWPLVSPERILQGINDVPLDDEMKLSPDHSLPTNLATTSFTAPRMDDLPAYTQSLLRIKLPINVTLASKKQPINSILELGVGSIIHFNKPCDEPLDLEVNGHRIAHGEAVKVGDKFGIRLRVVSLPDERFERLGTP